METPSSHSFFFKYCVCVVLRLACDSCCWTEAAHAFKMPQVPSGVHKAVSSLLEYISPGKPQISHAHWTGSFMRQNTKGTRNAWCCFSSATIIWKLEVMGGLCLCSWFLFSFCPQIKGVICYACIPLYFWGVQIGEWWLMEHVFISMALNVIIQRNMPFKKCVAVFFSS